MNQITASNVKAVWFGFMALLFWFSLTQHSPTTFKPDMSLRRTKKRRRRKKHTSKWKLCCSISAAGVNRQLFANMTPLDLVTLIKVSSQYVQNLKILTGSDRQQCNLHSIFSLQVNTKPTQFFQQLLNCLISLRFDLYSSNEMNAPPRKVFLGFFFQMN